MLQDVDTWKLKWRINCKLYKNHKLQKLPMLVQEVRKQGKK